MILSEVYDSAVEPVKSMIMMVRYDSTWKPVFTKVLGRQLFEKHRATVLNLPGKKAEVESTVMKGRLAEPGG